MKKILVRIHGSKKEFWIEIPDDIQIEVDKSLWVKKIKK